MKLKNVFVVGSTLLVGGLLATTMPASAQPDAPPAPAPGDDMIMVPRAQYEQLLRDVEQLKNQSGEQAAALGTSGAKPVDNNFYISANLGFQHRADAKDKLGAATVFDNPGYFTGGALGYRFLKNFRVEGEANLFNNVNKREIVTGAFNEPAQGNISLQTFMLNGYYDIPVKKGSKLKPFIGGGIGVFQSQVNGLTSKTLSTGVPGFFGPTVVDTKSKFTAAYQFKIGLGYAVSRKADIFVNYRLLRGSSFRLNSPTLGVLDVNKPRVNGFEVGVRANL